MNILLMKNITETFFKGLMDGAGALFQETKLLLCQESIVPANGVWNQSLWV